MIFTFSFFGVGIDFAKCNPLTWFSWIKGILLEYIFVSIENRMNIEYIVYMIRKPIKFHFTFRTMIIEASKHRNIRISNTEQRSPLIKISTSNFQILGIALKYFGRFSHSNIFEHFWTFLNIFDYLHFTIINFD